MIPMARIALLSEGPRTATMKIASSSAGKASSVSIARIVTVSSHPPK